MYDNLWTELVTKFLPGGKEAAIWGATACKAYFLHSRRRVIYIFVGSCAVFTEMSKIWGGFSTPKHLLVYGHAMMYIHNIIIIIIIILIHIYIGRALCTHSRACSIISSFEEIIFNRFVTCNGIVSAFEFSNKWLLYTNYSSHPCEQHEHAVHILSFPGDEGFNVVHSGDAVMLQV